MSKEELLDSIRPGMQMTEAFLLRVYGYSVTDPYYAGTALDYLEAAGCSRPREHYKKVISDWQAEHDAETDRAAAWYRQKVEEDQQEEVELWMKSVDSMTEAEAKAVLKEMVHC